jgi:hypothetical protein
MYDAARSPLVAWESFYTIVGSSAAALTGLQFVVIVLVAEVRRGTAGAVDAFATPTIVHFCVVLLVSAIVTAPWPSLAGPAFALGICGVAGVAYVAIVIARARRQTGYELVLEDWLWHIAFPLLAYAALLPAAVSLRSHALPSLFVVAATALLLLFIGIHNAWDAVTYITVDHLQKSGAPSGTS